MNMVGDYSLLKNENFFKNNKKKGKIQRHISKYYYINN
jgi:hypothetical protein